MAAARDMEGFVPLLSTTDTKQKLSVGQELLTYLQDGMPIECSDIGLVIDTLVPWIHSSNFKVSHMGIDLMSALAIRMGPYFKPYIPSVIPPVIDRLGDSKELVRERCQFLLGKLMEGGALTPQQLFERLGPAFSHKNGNVREEVLHCLVNTLNQHGAGSVSVSKLMPSIIKLLSDPNVQVRDATLSTLANIYRHVGDRLRNDLIKKNQVPPSKLPALLAKFDEIKAAGDLLPTALNANSNLDEDETDRNPVTVKRSNSAVSRKNITSSLKSLPQSSSQAGALDEQTFLQTFEDTPSVQIFGVKDLEEQLSNITKIISNPNNEWNKRVDALRKIRSLLVSGAANYEEFFGHLRLFDPPFQISLKDLRSQVVREACFTLAYMSQQLCNKLDHFVESMLPLLFNLIQNSAKVIASSAQVCVGFVVTHTHSARLVPLLCAPLSHKSRDIRRAATKFLHLILSNWNNHYLTKHAQLLQQSLNQAITDADQEVRMFARKAYWAFKTQFPELAEQLLNSLDATHKKTLHSDMSNSSSSNSLNQVQQSRPRVTETPTRRIMTSSVSTPRTGSPRSNSAIDLQAAQRAKARAQYAALARQKVGSNTSLPRPKKSTDAGPSSLVGSSSVERSGRQRTRHPAGVSHSQPSSRSGSPSSRLNYATYGFDRTRRSPSYSRSTAGSRETSPSRFSPLPPLSKLRGGGRTERTQIPSSRPPVMAQKMLQQSIEAENLFADEPDSHMDRSNFSPTRRLRDDHSDDSETSSICSERSFESYRRQSDSYSWSGSQQRIFRELWEPNLKDINDIIKAIESTHWSDRKDGLVSLSAYLRGGNDLTCQQLTRLTDNFTKMLSDSHTKVFSLFLDTVNDLICTHSADLNPWLYILLTRLFNKLGGDLLGSIQSKIHKTLQVVRDNFGSEAMLQWALRFLVDSTQTPNIKVKLNVLQFIAKLAPTADPTTSFPPPTPSKGNKDVTTAALNKMIGWTMGDSIKQGTELRRAAQEAIVALFNLNTPQITLRFSQLPKEYQEAAASLIEGRVRRASTASGGRDSPRQQDSLSPDQVYRSLRRTTAEIQNYTFDGKVEASSHDSGISQMSVNDRNDLDVFTSWTGSLSLGSPTKTNINGSIHAESAPEAILSGLSVDGLDEGEKIMKLMDAVEGRTPQYKSALSQLSNTIKNGDAELLAVHFKRLLRIFQYEVTSGEVEGKAQSLIALGEMMKKPLLHEKFESFVELILLRVIQAYGDSNKEVVKQAEICACIFATRLQMDLVLNVLTPLISTQDFPLNLAAIKIVTKMVEAKTQEEIMPYLPDLMPGIVQAYGNVESLVRKASVFCMVALHQRVGADAIKPHLTSLTPAKLKLLHLYITRTQPNGSTTTNTPHTP